MASWTDFVKFAGRNLPQNNKPGAVAPGFSWDDFVNFAGRNLPQNQSVPYQSMAQWGQGPDDGFRAGNEPAVYPPPVFPAVTPPVVANTPSVAPSRTAPVQRPPVAPVRNYTGPDDGFRRGNEPAVYPAPVVAPKARGFFDTLRSYGNRQAAYGRDNVFDKDH